MGGKVQIVTERAPVPRAAYSQGILKGGLVATTQIGDDPVSGELPEGIEAQVKQALDNVSAVLEAGGSGWDDVIKTTCYLTDLSDFSAFDRVYSRYVSDPRPTRSTIAVSLNTGILIELEVLAVL